MGHVCTVGRKQRNIFFKGYDHVIILYAAGPHFQALITVTTKLDIFEWSLKVSDILMDTFPSLVLKRWGTAAKQWEARWTVLPTLAQEIDSRIYYHWTMQLYRLQMVIYYRQFIFLLYLVIYISMSNYYLYN